MRAVSNTSPISNLAFIGQLSLLKQNFSQIWIPPAVLEELNAHPDAAAHAAIKAAIREKWIEASPLSSSPLLSLLSPHLHRGEAEAIALAAELKSDVVIIDEQEGRQFAAQSGLQVIGILGILLRAKKNGQIRAVGPEIKALRSKARFFVAANLESRILAAAGE
jgi:predicted nucleic acid-binding protein